MTADILLVLAGLALLVVGGDTLVKGAAGLALRLGLTPLVVGLTVVAFGTSAPELLVSVSAALKGSTDIALGNVVGSNIANVMLILGATALAAPIVTAGLELRESWAMMIAASLVIIALALIGPLGWPQGLLLLLLLGAIIWRQIATGKSDDDALPEGVHLERWRKVAQWLGIGLIALPLGAQMLVNGATDIARYFGISEAVIGLTLVAIGTSLPEMAASVAAALKGRADMALGNVIGSNIFNLLSILGITALIAPLPVPAQMLRLDLWVMLATSLLLMPFLFRAIPITRLTGTAMLAVYGLYIAALL